MGPPPAAVADASDLLHVHVAQRPGMIVLVAHGGDSFLSASSVGDSPFLMSGDTDAALTESSDGAVRTWPRGAAWIAAAVLVSAPAMQLASHLIEPTPRDTAARLAWVSDHPGAATLAKSLDLVALPFLVAVVVVYVLLSRQRSPALSYVGGSLLVTGLLGLAAVEGFETFAFIAVEDRGFDLPALAEVVDNQMAGPGAVMMVMFLIPALVGMLMIAAALWRSRSVPRTAVALVIAAFLGDAVVVEGAGAPHWTPHVVSLLAGAWIASAIVRARA